jgi:molecular chaperone HtpG
MEPKTNKFKAEIAEMLDLVVNSLYSKKEIFLRELISNSSDAIDRAKFLALTDKSIAPDDTQWAIKIAINKANRTIVISDNGIGMNLDELENNLGCIASSGTKKFREMLKESKGQDLPEMIGQFGVGFYAAFMVADKVVVDTMKRGTNEALRWESDMSGSYTISDSDRDFPGTSVTLYLREEHDEYFSTWRIKELIKKYSDFITYPITCRDLDVPKDEKEEDRKTREENENQPLNTMVALWKRQKKDVKKEEYDEFYRHLTHDYEQPFEVVPFSGEGQVEFKALIFFPKKPSFDLYMPNQKRGLSLYVRNVFISDDVEMLLPSYLRFIKGVVDSSDLQLNVSREMLQDDAIIQKIKSAITSKVLATLEDLKKKDLARYVEFFSAFGPVLKEGVHYDYQNSDRIKKLLMYPSANSEVGKKIFLEDYVKAMPQSQKDIYYILAGDEKEARNLPQLEAAKKHGFDVILFCDPVDEYLVESFYQFESKNFVDIAKGDFSFGTESEIKEEKEKADKLSSELKPFLDSVKENLSQYVSDVKLSNRLTQSPCCLVAAEGAMSASMIRMMKAMQQNVPEQKRVLELNPEHELIKKMQTLSGEKLSEMVSLLYDNALIAEGSPVVDAANFSKKMVELMMKA